MLSPANAYHYYYPLHTTGFFAGNAADFDLSWYLLVGVALGNTMLINAFTMQLPFLASELFVNPLKRLMQSTVANRVSQIHLNKAFAPSVFKIPIRLAMLVNTLIISLIFSSALPLLLPLAFVAFATAYVMDKVRTCVDPFTCHLNFHQRGPIHTN